MPDINNDSSAATPDELLGAMEEDGGVTLPAGIRMEEGGQDDLVRADAEPPAPEHSEADQQPKADEQPAPGPGAGPEVEDAASADAGSSLDLACSMDPATLMAFAISGNDPLEGREVTAENYLQGLGEMSKAELRAELDRLGDPAAQVRALSLYAAEFRTEMQREHEENQRRLNRMSGVIRAFEQHKQWALERRREIEKRLEKP